ncbi:NAD(P)/FAD-dependent oxidoreductase [Rugosimonospora acidiphila]|uniref:NAD(P)/FAD-dependent oxidoreductase n=1 Tax=Rugosimonospora acidiphila TaxID=556531 RepID=A0ABP9SQ98_9ACTN
MTTRSDLVIVGAGPAGLSAALAAAGAGVDVTVLDSNAAPGGQIWRQPASGAAGHPPAGRAARALSAVAAHPRVEVLSDRTVSLAEPDAGSGGVLFVQGPDGGETIRARALVLATGATELSLPFPGWDLPGVLTPGAAQAMLKAHGVLAGRRILVAGTGPFLWPVAAGLRRAGARIVALVDGARQGSTGLRLAGLARHPALVGQAAGFLRALAAGRVPVLGGRVVVAAHGRDAVESVTVARLDGRGRIASEGRREYAVDALCVGWGFVPSVELARSLGCAETVHPNRPGSAVTVDADQATTAPGVFAAGEVTGIGGAVVSWWEGMIAGAAAAHALGALPRQGFAERTRVARRRCGDARHAARLLERAFPPYPDWTDWLTPETVFCRCEEVTWQRMVDALDEGGEDVRTVKGQTRCGMGWCQGRVCGPAAQLAVARRLGRAPGDVGDLATRPLAVPIPIGLLGGAGRADETGD